MAIALIVRPAAICESSSSSSRAQPAGAPHGVHQGADDHRVEHRAAGGDLADRPRQLVALGDAVLQQVGVPGRALRQQRHGVLGVVVLAEDHDAGARMDLADLLDGVDALALEVRWHADVGDDDVGVQLGGAGDERVVVLGHADHLDVGIAGQHRPHPFPDDGAVVGQEHSDRPHGHRQAARHRVREGRHPAWRGCCWLHLAADVAPRWPVRRTTRHNAGVIGEAARMRDGRARSTAPRRDDRARPRRRARCRGADGDVGGRATHRRGRRSVHRQCRPARRAARLLSRGRRAG